ncbi:MAG: hypothetical protein AAF961_02825 [Planctomycetota bacterium]
MTAPDAATEPPAPPGSPPDKLEWIDWPLRDRGWQSVLVASTLIALAALVGWRSSSVVAGLATCCALAISMASYWLPTHYTVDAHGVLVFRLGRSRWLPWQLVRIVMERPSGALLFRAERCRWLDAIDATFVPWGPDSDGVRKLIDQRCAHAQRAEG